MKPLRFPRTLNEAFGPYSTGPVAPPTSPADLEARARVPELLMLMLAAVFIVAAFFGWV